VAGEKVAFEKQADAETEAGRGRSTIEFPYGDLEDAEELTQALHSNAGTTSTVEQLAAYMGQAARGGGFRTRITTAKTFGLIDNPRGQVVLTELGSKMVDPKLQSIARVESFLKVPLFAALFNKFKSGVLPPRAALTREIQTLGVIETQADRARQAFERSAERAGFFAHGRDRLVMPVVHAAKSEKPKDEDKTEKPKRSGSGGDGGDFDPLLWGLLSRLPSTDTEWPIEARVTWLKALVTNFDILYGPTDRPITVTDHQL
jgi:hypothetical protein